MMLPGVMRGIFIIREPFGDIIPRRALVADVCDETGGAEDSGFLKQVVEEFARGSDEGDALQNLLPSWGFADYTDLSGHGAGGSHRALSFS